MAINKSVVNNTMKDDGLTANGTNATNSGNSTAASSSAINTNVYDEMTAQAIANGKSNGKSDPYSNYINAQNTSASLWDYYNNNKESMTTNQQNAMTSLLANAATKEQAAGDYYNQYLENQRGAENAKVAAYNAEQNAMKYTQNALAANGMASQGLAESTRAGIGINYANLVAAANMSRDSANSELLKSYQNNMSNYNLQDMSTINSAREADNTTLGSMFLNDITSALATADFATADKILNDPNFSSLSPNTQKEVLSTYNELKKSAYTSIIGDSETAGTLSYKNVSDTAKEAFLNGMINGTIQPNTYVVIETKKDKVRDKNVYYIDESGKIKEVDYKDAEGNKTYVISNAGSGKYYDSFKRNWWNKKTSD